MATEAESEGHIPRPGALLYQRHFTAAEPKATAVVMHGLNEHSGRYLQLCRLLASAGIDVLALDGRGFGRTSGARGDSLHFAERLDDLQWAVETQRARHPGLPLVLIGHSLGGLIVTRYAQSTRPAADLLVLSGPAIDPRKSWWQAAQLAAARQLVRLIPTVRVPFGTLGALSTDPAVARAARQDPLWVSGIAIRLAVQIEEEQRHAWQELGRIHRPVLLLHGGDDPLIPATASRQAAERLATDDVTVRIYPGMLHEVFNEREKEQVFRDLRAWLLPRIVSA